MNYFAVKRRSRPVCLPRTEVYEKPRRTQRSAPTLNFSIRIILLFLILFSGGSFSDTAHAQNPVDVCHAEVYDSFRISRGNIVKVGNTLVFIDEGNLRTSFSVDRRNIRSLNRQAGMYSVMMPASINDYPAAPRRFDFQLIYGNCDQIAQWLRNATSSPRGSSSFKKTYWVAHKRSFATDLTGKLSVSNKMIDFDCFRDGSLSRRWKLKDIKTIQENGPDEIVVVPFIGDRYTFEFQDKGMSHAEFKALKASIIRSPSAKY
jgi:hypothetical protein